jgi:biotin synthase
MTTYGAVSAEPTSPEYVRLSLAAAMTLDLIPGWFYRNARLGCINLLLTYEGGCRANCAFCGLASEKRGGSHSKFIRVPWKTYPVDEVIERIAAAPPHVQRVCVSMITHPRAVQDTLDLCRAVTDRTEKSVSLLISPSTLRRGDLERMKDAGAERVGVAVDAATPEIFSQLRGKPVQGPHSWDRYWAVFDESLRIFGRGMAGVHLIYGLGETERELAGAMQRAADMGGSTHLFSFFPEPGSLMEETPQPPIGGYRRIQLARYLIDSGISGVAGMCFDERGRITDFGLAAEKLDAAIETGVPFETSGCPGRDGRTACNRPYGNEKPGPAIRNFPFSPNADDIARCRAELLDYPE